MNLKSPHDSKSAVLMAESLLERRGYVVLSLLPNRQPFSPGEQTGELWSIQTDRIFEVTEETDKADWESQRDMVRELIGAPPVGPEKRPFVQFVRAVLA